MCSSVVVFCPHTSGIVLAWLINQNELNANSSLLILPKRLSQREQTAQGVVNYIMQLSVVR